MGQEIYRHDCQTCHGEGGAGDGFNAFNLDPRPRDLIARRETSAERLDQRGLAGTDRPADTDL